MTSIVRAPVTFSRVMEVSSLPLALFVLLLAAGLYIVFVYLFHPLSRVPSIHWSAPFSSYYFLYMTYANSRRDFLYITHNDRQESGQPRPVLRVGPSEVSITSNEGVRLVYGSGFERSHWYSLFRNFGYAGRLNTEGVNYVWTG